MLALVLCFVISKKEGYAAELFRRSKCCVQNNKRRRKKRQRSEFKSAVSIFLRNVNSQVTMVVRFVLVVARGIGRRLLTDTICSATEILGPNRSLLQPID